MSAGYLRNSLIPHSMLVKTFHHIQGWFKSLPDDVIAGAFAGLVARMLTAPLDVLKIRYQLNAHGIASSPSMFHAAQTIVRREGFTALWKGNVPALCLWVSYAIVQFAAYDVLKEAINEDVEAPRRRALGVFLAGALASTTATLATYPFDITRTQLAVQGPGTQRAFSSMNSFLSHTLATRGVSGLYAGLGPAVLSVTPHMGLSFAIYESLKAGLPDGHYNHTHGWSRTLKKGLLGGIAGGTSKLLVYPLDTVKKRLQVQLPHTPHHTHTNGMMACVRGIYAAEGVRGFYRGIAPTTAKACLATAITFAAFEVPHPHPLLCLC